MSDVMYVTSVHSLSICSECTIIDSSMSDLFCLSSDLCLYISDAPARCFMGVMAATGDEDARIGGPATGETPGLHLLGPLPFLKYLPLYLSFSFFFVVLGFRVCSLCSHCFSVSLLFL